MLSRDEVEAGHIEAIIVALPETSGSALYGLVDLLSLTSHMSSLPGGREAYCRTIRPRIACLSASAFQCTNSTPVTPELEVGSDEQFSIIIVPELWLTDLSSFFGKYPDLARWIRKQYESGSCIYSSCSGSLVLAESGILNGKHATSHWMHQELFKREYPLVEFDSSSIIVFSDADGRVVTAGGSTSWQDLALHIISRFCSINAARWVAKFSLINGHEEGQLPYAYLIPARQHQDAEINACEQWLASNYQEPAVVSKAVMASTLSERTLKRRFKQATGFSIMDYVHRLRIEAAKSHLEKTSATFEHIAGFVGYEETPFFRRLFKRYVGLTPKAYRQMFRSGK